jgi:MYXO-CTERM domain-containing protein
MPTKSAPRAGRSPGTAPTPRFSRSTAATSRPTPRFTRPGAAAARPGPRFKPTVGRRRQPEPTGAKKVLSALGGALPKAASAKAVKGAAPSKGKGGLGLALVGLAGVALKQRRSGGPSGDVAPVAVSPNGAPHVPA